MASYKVDQKEVQAVISGVQKSRLIWSLSVMALIFPWYLWSYLEKSTGSVTDYVTYLLAGGLIVFSVYKSVPRLLDGLEIGLDSSSVSRKAPRGYSLPLDRVWFIRETDNGLLVYARWGRRIWIPRALKRFDELKTNLLARVDPKTRRWTRIPTLWFWSVCAVLGIVASIYFGEIIYAYTALILALINISFLLYFE